MKHKIHQTAVPRETFEQVDVLLKANASLISTYIDQLLWWNKRINLISRDVPRETVEKHVRHSLLVSQLPAFESSNLIVDAGSGGGLPGIPLACCFPKISFIINDIVSKKVMATKQISRKTGLKNVQFSDSSIENITLEEPFLLITKHAFKINQLYKMVCQKPWTSIIMYKGLSYQNELQGISTPLSIQQYDLSSDTKDNFYDGKALLVIKKFD